MNIKCVLTILYFFFFTANYNEIFLKELLFFTFFNILLSINEEKQKINKSKEFKYYNEVVVVVFIFRKNIYDKVIRQWNQGKKHVCSYSFDRR